MLLTSTLQELQKDHQLECLNQIQEIIRLLSDDNWRISLTFVLNVFSITRNDGLRFNLYFPDEQGSLDYCPGKLLNKFLGSPAADVTRQLFRDSTKAYFVPVTIDKTPAQIAIELQHSLQEIRA